jgi:hypothetical protein
MFYIWLPVQAECSGYLIVFLCDLWSLSCSCDCFATRHLSWGWIVTSWLKLFFSTLSGYPATSTGWSASALGFRCCIPTQTLATAVLSSLQRWRCSDYLSGLPCCPPSRACFRPSLNAVYLRACWFFVWLFGWSWIVFFQWIPLERELECCLILGGVVDWVSMRGSWWEVLRNCCRLCVLRVVFRSFLN